MDTNSKYRYIGVVFVLVPTSRFWKTYGFLCKNLWILTLQQKFHEQFIYLPGVYDLPKMIDYILISTNQTTIQYLAHSQGMIWIRIIKLANFTIPIDSKTPNSIYRNDSILCNVIRKARIQCENRKNACIGPGYIFTTCTQSTDPCAYTISIYTPSKLFNSRDFRRDFHRKRRICFKFEIILIISTLDHLQMDRFL